MATQHHKKLLEWKNAFFFDKYLFLLQEIRNQENDHIWAVSLASVPEVPVSKTCKLFLLFIGRLWRLSQWLFTSKTFKRTNIIFSNRTAHRQTRKKENTLNSGFPRLCPIIDLLPHFRTSIYWNSTCYMLSKLTNTKNMTLTQVKVILTKIWENTPQSVVPCAFVSFDKCLRAVIL
jgi:hypothetical protein